MEDEALGLPLDVDRFRAKLMRGAHLRTSHFRSSLMHKKPLCEEREAFRKGLVAIFEQGDSPCVAFLEASACGDVPMQ